MAGQFPGQSKQTCITAKLSQLTVIFILIVQLIKSETLSFSATT